MGLSLRCREKVLCSMCAVFGVWITFLLPRMYLKQIEPVLVVSFCFCFLVGEGFEIGFLCVDLAILELPL